MSRLNKTPWGFFELLETGVQHKVKTLTIRCGEATSLQVHQRRDEHWIVVRGEVSVVIGDLEKAVGVNEYVFVKRGVQHSIANYQETTAELVEVQFGDELSEDDIIRIEDRYDRGTTKAPKS
mgnify:FL=1